jgi:hypothetical protein
VLLRGLGAEHHGAARLSREDVDGLLERQRLGPGELVDPAVVAVLGQDRGGDRRDVLDGDERLRSALQRQGQLAREERGAVVAFAEVLIEVVGLQDGPLDTGASDRFLEAVHADRLGADADGFGEDVDAPSRLGDQAAHARVDGRGDERLGRDRLVRRDQVRGGDAVERGRPRGLVVPVEADLGAARDRADRLPGFTQTGDQAAADLAGRADDQDRVVLVNAHVPQSSP